MTRLKADDIKKIASRLDRYDRELTQKTGVTLRGIACHALGIPEGTFRSVAGSVEVGVVPITSGGGILEGFAQTVQRIVRHIGFKAFVTLNRDVAGIAEAVEKNAEVLMMADDQRFVALNTRSNRMSDNAIATGKGYAAGLDLMAGGLEGQKVLVIGCGAVGRSAVNAILQRGAEAAVFDINPQYGYQLANEIYKSTRKRIIIEIDLKKALQQYHLLLEATDASGIIDANTIRPYTHVAAPGIPLGLTPAAVEKISGRLLHDPLQIGTAVMAVDAVLSRSIEEWRIMLPYGSYIAQVAKPQPKYSRGEPDQQKTSPGQDPRGVTKVSEPAEQDSMGTTKVSDPEPEPEPESESESEPPANLPEEDKHERTEIL
jgi:pyrrolysine biosynthesis protein PylD